MMKLRHILLGVLTSLALSSFAQLLPVQSSSILNSPGSVFISDYTAPGSNRWQTTLTFQDFNESSIDVRLRLIIESAAVKIETKPTYIPIAPITLFPGTPVILSGSDISEYLAYSNMNYLGISRQALEGSGKLPEGMYSFRVEVLEWNTGKKIAQDAFSSAYLQLKDQPLTLMPLCGSAVSPTGGQNFTMQWQYSGPISPNPGSFTEYQLTFYEITDNSIDPMLALNNNKVLQVYQTNWQVPTTYIYTASDPTLELGKKYLYRVQARDERGTESFKNDGYAEVCWFSYGFPTGGTVQLTAPDNDFSFTNADNRFFKWDAIDNGISGQQVEFTLNIYEINAGQTPQQAVDNNSPSIQQISSAVPSTNGLEVLLQDTFPTQKEFAWQVVAMSGSQQVAESEVRTFTSPPMIEQFLAGTHLVKVNRLTNANLSSLDGEGSIKIGGDDSSWVDVSFSGLDIQKVSGQYTLNNGEILHQVTDMQSIALTPQLEELPEAEFIPEEIKLSKTELSVKGTIKMPLPLAVNGSSQAYVQSQSDWMTFDTYELAGSLKFNDQSTYNLLDPMNFTINYDENQANFLVSGNEFVLDMSGEISLPSGVNDIDGSPVVIPFVGFDRFSTNTIEDIQYLSQTRFATIPNTKIEAVPTKVIVDFSDSDSPGELSAQGDWTGIYFETVDLVFPKDLDGNQQLYLVNPLNLDAASTNSYINKLWIDAGGLQLDANYTPSSDVLGTLNTFIAKVQKIEIDIEDNAVAGGEWLVDIGIPVMSTEDLYQTTMPVTSSGFDVPYFESSFQELIVFDEGNDKRETVVTCKSPTFDSDGNLDMTVDVNIESLGAEIKDVSSFKINGSGQMGVNEIGKPVALNSPTRADLEGIPLEIDSLVVGKTETGYGIGVSGTVGLGSMVSGENGPVRTLLTAVSPVGETDFGFDAGVILEDENGDPAIGAQASGSVSVTSPLVNGLNDAVGALTGDKIQFHSKLEAGAGASTIATKDGFQSKIFAKLDLGFVSAQGNLYNEFTTKYGGGMMVFQGGADFSSAIPGIPFGGIGAQLMLGTHVASNGAPKPITLVRAYVNGVGIGYSPYIAFDNVGLAIGTFVAPESYMPDFEDLKPTTETNYSVDLNAPFTMMLNLGITDAVTQFEGIIYRATIWGGGRIDAPDGLDFTDPSSLLNLQICETRGIKGSLINFNAGPLGLFIKDGEMMTLQGGGDFCVGKVSSLNAIVQGKAYMQVPLVPGLPLQPLFWCVEGEVETDIKLDFGRITDLNASHFSFYLGTKRMPLAIKPWCVSLAETYGWIGLGIKNSELFLDMGMGLRTDVNLQSPNIPIGFMGDYIRPYFELKSTIEASAYSNFALENLVKPLDPKFAYGLNVLADFYLNAGVDYKFGLSKGNLTLGQILLRADGKYDVDQTGVYLSGDFAAGINVLNQGFYVDWNGKVKLLSLQNP